ncbi:MAG: flavodoxin domain-containing protein [Verrucomicrobiota bacterium]
MKNYSVLYGTETGTAEDLADDLVKVLAEHGIDIPSTNVDSVSSEVFRDSDVILMIISTWGDGEPPTDAEDFYNEVNALSDGTFSGQFRFAVFGLGDTGYELFCQCAKDFDAAFERIGGDRILPRVDADIDYEEPFEGWTKSIGQFCAENRLLAA